MGSLEQVFLVSTQVFLSKYKDNNGVDVWLYPIQMESSCRDTILSILNKEIYLARSGQLLQKKI